MSLSCNIAPNQLFCRHLPLPSVFYSDCDDGAVRLKPKPEYVDAVLMVMSAEMNANFFQITLSEVFTRILTTELCRPSGYLCHAHTISSLI